jgi:hypothetical protein
VNRDLEDLLRRPVSPQPAQDQANSAGARLQELRVWQSQRLARTYADLHRDARYARAIEFFLHDLYGPQDCAQRDRELARAWRHLKRSLPRALLSVLRHAIELDVITRELDVRMAGTLAPGPVSGATYAAAYRAVGQRRARLRQIALIVSIGEHLDRLCRHTWIELALRVARQPAHAAGLGVLQDFLERGFQAFRHMKGAGVLLSAIREREMRLLRALFDGRGIPADIGALRAGGGDG